MLSELHNLSSKLCSEQYNKNFVLHLIVVPQLGGRRRHNYSTKTRQAGRANEQSLMSMIYIQEGKLLDIIWGATLAQWSCEGGKTKLRTISGSCPSPNKLKIRVLKFFSHSDFKFRLCYFLHLLATEQPILTNVNNFLNTNI